MTGAKPIFVTTRMRAYAIRVLRRRSGGLTPNQIVTLTLYKVFEREGCFDLRRLFDTCEWHQDRSGIAKEQVAIVQRCEAAGITLKMLIFAYAHRMKRGHYTGDKGREYDTYIDTLPLAIKSLRVAGLQLPDGLTSFLNYVKIAYLTNDNLQYCWDGLVSHTFAEAK